MGWLLLGLAVCVVAQLDGGLYAVLDYRMHHGRLPLGQAQRRDRIPTLDPSPEILRA